MSYLKRRGYVAGDYRSLISAMSSEVMVRGSRNEEIKLPPPWPHMLNGRSMKYKCSCQLFLQLSKTHIFQSME